MTRRSSYYRGNNVNAMMFKVMMAIIAFFVVVVFFIGLLTAKAPQQFVGLFDKTQRDLITQEKVELFEWQVFAKKLAILVFRVGFPIILLAVVAFLSFKLAQILVDFLERKARQIYAKQGLYPIIVEKPTETYYDANRAIGDNLLLSMQALETQKAAAMSAEKINVTYNDKRDVFNDTFSDEFDEEDRQLPKEKIFLADLLKQEKVTPSIENLIVGVSEDGVEQMSLYQMMHTIIAGASGWGKSKMLAMLMYQLAACSEEFDVAAIDISGTCFNPILEWDRLLYPVAKEVDDAAAILSAINEEIKRRKQLFLKCTLAENIESYNKLSEQPIKPIIILIDEGTQLLTRNLEIGDVIQDVVQTSRQYGVYVVITGQSIKYNIVNTETRDNFSSRFAFYMPSKSSVKMVIGASMEPPRVQGKCLAMLQGQLPKTLQIPFVDRIELQNMIKKHSGSPQIIDMPKTPKDAEEIALAEDAKRLEQEGLSRTAIAAELFTYANGRTIAKVDKLLTTT